MVLMQRIEEGHMARTPLAGVVEQAVAEIAQQRTSRRELLVRGAALGLAATSAGAFVRAAKAAAAPRIVVVGAGLAGLTCAYRLEQAGITAQVYEASDRIGGR